jgi:hypothetical protein
MVGEVLETLIHQQHEEFTTGPEEKADTAAPGARAARSSE